MKSLSLSRPAMILERTHTSLNIPLYFPASTALPKSWERVKCTTQEEQKYSKGVSRPEYYESLQKNYVTALSLTLAISAAGIGSVFPRTAPRKQRARYRRSL